MCFSEVVVVLVVPVAVVVMDMPVGMYTRGCSCRSQRSPSYFLKHNLSLDLISLTG